MKCRVMVDGELEGMRKWLVVGASDDLSLNVAGGIERNDKK